MVRELSEKFATYLCFNERNLTPAMQVDFGVDNNQIYTAYREAFMEDYITMEDLDECLGNGPKLTALLRKAPFNKDVTITTSYDCMREAGMAV